MKIKVIVESCEEMNVAYDPDRANDGGGYHQPEYKGKITWEGCQEPIVFTLSDTSCGDFGNRYSIRFEGLINGTLSYDEMDNCGETVESTIPMNSTTIAIRDAIKDELGYEFIFYDEWYDEDEDEDEEEDEEEDDSWHRF